jgi:hypothetical protein
VITNTHLEGKNEKNMKFWLFWDNFLLKTDGIHLNPHAKNSKNQRNFGISEN